MDSSEPRPYLREATKPLEDLLKLRGVRADPVSSRFDLNHIIETLCKTIRDGDVIVFSSKFLAISQGRVVDLRTVNVTHKADEFATRYRIDPRLCELVIRESDEVIGGVPGFLLAVRDGLLTPNAGIDKSNIGHGKVVLYPWHPEQLADRIRKSIQFASGISVAVVICDSRLSPTRKGTIGVAVAASGLRAILDMRGKRDLFGNVLKVTAQAVADDLSSAAELLMGESDEGTPIIIVSGLGKELGDFEYPPGKFSIPMDECVYLRSLGHKSGRHRLLASGGTPRNR
jgi:coenzyme F420-0:L-glutamate ligase